jgi:integrase
VRKTGATAKHRPRVGVETPLPANPVAVAALRFALLTGMRKREVLGLRWAEVDRGAGLLRLDATKTGRSVRPLSAAARGVLDSLPRIVGAPFVFPSPRDPMRPMTNVERLWDAVRHSAGLDGTRLHDLRHTAASTMLQAGATLAEVGRALGHTSSRTTERYAHISDDGAQRAADLLGAAVARAAAAPDTPVVRLAPNATTGR